MRVNRVHSQDFLLERFVVPLLNTQCFLQRSRQIIGVMIEAPIVKTHTGEKLKNDKTCG